MMKKLTTYLIPLVVLGAFVVQASPASAKVKPECKDIKSQIKKLQKKSASQRLLLVTAKAELGAAEAKAIILTKRYHKAKNKLRLAKIAAIWPSNEGGPFITDKEQAKINRQKKALDKAKKVSLKQGRVVDAKENKVNKITKDSILVFRQIKAKIRAFERALERLNC